MMLSLPHMTAGENVAFGLNRPRRPASETRRVVNETLARALAAQPRVLLLDEPPSALDLKTLQRETGIIFILATHDQEEAFTMCDRIGVVPAGRIQKVGTPDETYERPVNTFLADFMGETDLLEATPVEAADDLVRCRLEGGIELLVTPAPGACAQGRVTLSLRPERIVVSASAADGLAGRVADCVYRGADLVYRVEFEEGPELTVREQNVTGWVESIGPGDSLFSGIATGAPRMLPD